MDGGSYRGEIEEQHRSYLDFADQELDHCTTLVSSHQVKIRRP